MKNVRTLAYLMAITMVSTVGFVSCKDKNAPEESKNQQTQQQLAEGDVVKTEFSIALPDQLSASGMPRRMPSGTVQNAGISEFQGMTGITLLPFARFSGAIESGDLRLGGANISLTEDLDKADVESKTSKAKVYENVNIPLTTASFLFYAKSKASGSKFEVGSLVPSYSDLDAEPAGISFALEPIMATPTTEYTTAHDALLAYLTSIAAANNGAGTPKAWYEITDGDDPGMKALFDTYSTMKGLSTFEVERVLSDLNKTIKPLRTTNTLANNIALAIANGTYATVDGGTDKVTLVSGLQGFPQNYNLPVGSVNIAWNGTAHEFQEGAYSNMAALNTYVYPAQLWYFANSLIKTSNQSKKTAYSNTSYTWDYILGLHTDATSVNSLTRAVAIKDKIQYAVARLDVAAKVSSLTLADNSKSATDTAIAVAVPAGGFPITAILVGGQRDVNFDFTAKATGTEYTIYDNVMAAGDAMKASTTLSSYNHTLVLENGTADVMVAVEMVNNTGVDFYGIGNQLIPAGGKFYVVAKLAAAAAATETGGHVFKQDYKTIANLTLTDLTKAYNTIPDLRTPQLELGFSVDLEWQAGHIYNIDFGNN